MKPVMAICSIMLVTTPAAGFAQDRSYPDFGSVAKTAGPAPENGPVSAGRPVATRGGPDAAVERTRQEVKMLDDLFKNAIVKLPYATPISKEIRGTWAHWLTRCP
jgi:hypothetical protein